MTLRAGLVCDLAEEHWPSMDLVADELMRTLRHVGPPSVTPIRIQPTVPHWGRTAARALGLRALVNASRYIDRHHRYARWLRRQRPECDVYHVLDHSYAHLVASLPAARTVVTCHDVDAFRCLFDPVAEPRSSAFRAMTRRILTGLRTAAAVTCDSNATRDALVAHGLRSHDLTVIPLGVDSLFTPSPDPADGADVGASPVLLHVGSVIPRKRIDRLLEIVAAVHQLHPTLRLVRVGGSFTAEQRAQVDRLHLTSTVTVMPVLSRPELVEAYRRATLVLLPSDAEGFGLPLLEGLACGTPVIASDLPVLREVGGNAATYVRTDNVGAWVRAADALLVERTGDPGAWRRRRDMGVRWAARFTWNRCAGRMAEVYESVAHG